MKPNTFPKKRPILALPSQGYACLLLISLGITWSLAYSIARYCVTHGVHPLGYAFWQALGPAIVLSLICFIRKTTIPFSPNFLFFYGFSGLIGIALPNANMYYSAAHLPSGILAVIINTAPILTYLLALGFQAETFAMKRVTGVLLAVIGIYVIANPEHVFMGHADLYWILRSLTTPFCFALCAVYIARYRPKNSDAFAVAAGMLWAASIYLAITVIPSHHFYAFDSHFDRVQQYILLEIVLSSLGYWLFFQLLQKAGAVYYSLVAGIVSIAGLFWGWLFFQEHLQFFEIIGVVSILLGIFLVSLLQ